jgi:hypothetical protein
MNKVLCLFFLISLSSCSFFGLHPDIIADTELLLDDVLEDAAEIEHKQNKGK